jgi:hypothetical protein
VFKHRHRVQIQDMAAVKEYWDLPDNFTEAAAAALSRVEDYWERIGYLRRLFENDPCADLLAKYGQNPADSATPPAPV